MSISVAPKVAIPTRLAGNLQVSFVTLTFSGNYAAGGETPPRTGIAGLNTTAFPLALMGTTDTGYNCRLESDGKLTLWDGKNEMANAVPYDAATADVAIFTEKY